MKNQRFFRISGICLITFLIFSCKTQKVQQAPPVAVNCGEAKPTYTADIKPILDLHCASTCHSSEKKAAGITLAAYEEAKVQAFKRRFLGAIRHDAGYTAMPRKNPKLSDNDITKIACWIQSGCMQ